LTTADSGGDNRASMRSKYVTVDGVAVNYFHTGASTLPTTPPPLDQGEVLLFIHGAGSNAHTWRHQLEHFDARHSAVAFDFPGHGRSGSTEGLKSIDAYAQFTAAFGEAVRLRPAVLVGRAMGGAVALTLALAQPQRVRALVLVATTTRFEIPEQSLDTWRQVMLGRATQPFSTALFSPKTEFAVMREAWMEQVKTDPRVRYHDLVACNGVDFSDRLAALKVPTLVITGREDHFAPPEKAEDLQRRIPGARLVIIDDAGHTLSSEQPAAFNAAIEEFVGHL
jgi:pimeloyl-ACP methyl ester carboxylesterase